MNWNAQINKNIKFTYSTKLQTFVKVNNLECPYQKGFFFIIMQFALLSIFISKEESDLPSRTNEVVRCEERLLASCRGGNTSLPSFLIHSFNEVGNKGLPAVAYGSPILPTTNDNFTVVDLVTWPLNGSEAGVTRRRTRAKTCFQVTSNV